MILLIYLVNQMTARFGNVERNCELCNSGPETISHLFFEWFHNCMFWLDVEYLYNNVTGSKLQLCEKNIKFFYKGSKDL